MKNTVVTFKQAKEKGEKLTMLTAYDYSTAKLIDEAGINAILVGDSLGMVVLGYEDTLSVPLSRLIRILKLIQTAHRNSHHLRLFSTILLELLPHKLILRICRCDVKIYVLSL